ncbi:acyl transferase 15-like [Triticum dicoccoides]|uniref:acyl transferase 15-like n=1 Tax=Triticum dicoccoides TaxID=85692 RepID=UPI0018909BA1|nr:acyl transferase 15-like [Triticum dicoccoides]
MMSDAVVTKSPAVVVGPSEPGTPTGIISLSSFDKVHIPIPMALLLIFDEPIDDPAETIKKALSRALVPYHPMAGRLVAGADDDAYLSIACTGEGVPFVAASASCALEEAMTALSPGLLRELTVRYPGELCRLSDALVLMQVTEFTCGGFVVGVTWNHVMADGAGIAQFLQAVGELARGMGAPSVVPVRSGATIPPIPTPVVAALRSQMQVLTEELASLDVMIPSSLISRVKAECSGGSTTFEVVAAALWRSRTRAIFSGSGNGDPDAPAMLCFPKNVREKVGAEHGYYGNCLSSQLVLATNGTVASSEIKDLVKLIKGHADILDLLKNGGAASGVDLGRLMSSPRYHTIAVSSWRNLGMEATDFGGGKPARAMWQPENSAGFLCVVCPPCKGKDGVNVLSRCVTPEHAEAFLRELAALDM